MKYIYIVAAVIPLLLAACVQKIGKSHQETNKFFVTSETGVRLCIRFGSPPYKEEARDIVDGQTITIRNVTIADDKGILTATNGEKKYVVKVPCTHALNVIPETGHFLLLEGTPMWERGPLE